MKTFVCNVCGHIEFNEVTEACLVCQAAPDKFTEDAGAIKQPENPAELTEGDKKHIPQITIVRECGLIPGGCCYDAHTRVGEIEHVMQAEHHIKYLDYYIDYKFISRIWLSPEVCHPAAALHLVATSGKLTVVENCNVHGNWMAEAELAAV